MAGGCAFPSWAACTASASASSCGVPHRAADFSRSPPQQRLQLGPATATSTSTSTSSSIAPSRQCARRTFPRHFLQSEDGRGLRHCHNHQLVWNWQRSEPGAGLEPRRRSAAAAAAAAGAGGETGSGERVYFDGGVHYGDLVTNLAFGLTLVWLPLTFGAVFRALFLRYRVTDARVTVQSGLLGGERKDFQYDVVRDVKVVPRFIGEWGDMSIELKDGTRVEMKSVPKFREIAKYVEEMAAAARGAEKKRGSGPSVVSSSGSKSGSKKGFS